MEQDDINSVYMLSFNHEYAKNNGECN